MSNDNDIVDHTIFDQLLEMDEGDEDQEFSKGIVINYFEQAEQTFVDMDESLKAKDLSNLSKLGHFLKGSSAALGLTKVKTHCEHIQYFGNLKDETGSNPVSEEVALARITALLAATKKDYEEAAAYLRNYYNM
ncbi:hypothetical protein CXG81DRAFT_14438 [Caulochytrium protostelioides]|uniref:HPt domain-containing protein n=1 Tax=Caulochytrium protostelioides TaxID=1555241 RepID=A0A4P9X391_9FUNG|nr:hypothetical protein CXG81DRAFT_14438 [Caulochytrium protostelioides]|eukprot:RKO99485.1 hypothetical protein CXG81DRAFT_14438 [Caulochytrium protostelioides]